MVDWLQNCLVASALTGASAPPLPAGRLRQEHATNIEPSGGAPDIRPSVKAGLHVVAIQAAVCSPYKTVVATLAHGHGSHGGLWVALRLPLLAHRGPQHILTQGEVLQAPSIGRAVPLMTCDGVAPVLLPHLHRQEHQSRTGLVLGAYLIRVKWRSQLACSPSPWPVMTVATGLDGLSSACSGQTATAGATPKRLLLRRGCAGC